MKKDKDEVKKIAKDLKAEGFSPVIVNTINWSELNYDNWYVVSSGIYTSKSEANAALLEVQEYYPSAYVKYSGTYIEGEPDEYPSVSNSKIHSIEASSTLEWNGKLYPPKQICDGSLELAWQEGVAGFGVGEYVTVHFDGVFKVRGMVINAGYQKDVDLYFENGRPRDILITFSDGSSQGYFLEDYCEAQTIYFDEPVDTSSVQITILSVYEGEKYEDTSISEVSFF